MSHFRSLDRDVDFLLPPSVQEWLPEGHLARYVVEVVEGLDLSALEPAYAVRGIPALCHPAMLLSLLIYGYAIGWYSSRKIERASIDPLQGATAVVTAFPTGADIGRWHEDAPVMVGKSDTARSCR